MDFQSVFPFSSSRAALNTSTGGSWFAMPGATNAIAGVDQKFSLPSSPAWLNGVVHVLIDPADGGPVFTWDNNSIVLNAAPSAAATPWLAITHRGQPTLVRTPTAPTPNWYDCDGNCLNDSDSDGICGGFEIAGCTDAATLVTTDATDENGYCAYATDLNCADETACNYQPFAGPAYLAN